MRHSVADELLDRTGNARREELPRRHPVGSRHLEPIVQFLRDLEARAREQPDLRVLIDESDLDLELIGFRGIQQIVEAWRKVAVQGISMAVFAPGVMTFGLNRMFVLIAQTENVEVFLARPDAIAWLLNH